MKLSGNQRATIALSSHQDIQHKYQSPDALAYKINLDKLAERDKELFPTFNSLIFGLGGIQTPLVQSGIETKSTKIPVTHSPGGIFSRFGARRTAEVDFDALMAIKTPEKSREIPMREMTADEDIAFVNQEEIEPEIEREGSDRLGMGFRKPFRAIKTNHHLQNTDRHAENKAISSEDYFGRSREEDMDANERLSMLEDASSISSDDIQGRRVERPTSEFDSIKRFLSRSTSKV